MLPVPTEPDALPPAKGMLPDPTDPDALPLADGVLLDPTEPEVLPPADGVPPDTEPDVLPPAVPGADVCALAPGPTDVLGGQSWLLGLGVAL